MKTYEQRLREEFEKVAAREGLPVMADGEDYYHHETSAAYRLFRAAHKDFQTIADYVAMFPTKAAAARALNVDNKQLNRWEHARAVLVGGVIYNRRKKDQ